MLFSSLLFLFIFLPIFLLIYYLVPSKIKNIVLLVFSLIFYAWSGPKYVILLLVVSLLNYLGAILLNKYKNKKRLVVILCIITNILILGYFKYSNFIIDNLNSFGLNISVLDIALPLGISFYIFQSMSYLIDVYRGKISIEKNYLKLLTYVSMFPKLIEGPIVRYGDIEKELKSRKIDFTSFSEGLFIFLTGLFAKVLIANNVGHLHSLIVSDISSISLLTAWLGMIAYTLQIYFDFNGYSTMAIGLGKMLGFTIPKNFNYPYVSTSITDFWRRWHITLSTWFKDYVYIPLGGNRVSKFRLVINLIIVWTLTGIWHGASWNFVIWGLYFGLLLIIEKLFLGKKLEKLPIVFQHIYTLFFITIGWLIFFSSDLTLLGNYLSKAFCNPTIIDNEFIFYIKNNLVFLLSGIIFSIPFVNKIKVNKVLKVGIIIIYVLLFIICICQLLSDSYNPFLYFRF